MRIKPSGDVYWCKKTIADYTNNQAIHDILIAIGVDYIQGTSVAKPFELEKL